MGLCINPDCEKAKKQEDQGLSLFCTGCGSSLLIHDLYRVIKYLGGGGFGTTYLVDDCGTPKVLKILHNTDPKAIALFDQEALVLQKLNHPGIPKVETGGRFDYLPRGSQKPLRCLVMEYIEGETLEDYLAKNNYRPISEKAAVRWLQQLLEILALVHSANYFHRDIKPANVMLRSSGPIALIDFGTAREETQTYLQKQQGKQVTGIVSVGYTPYEQEHGQAEYRSDFFAVGRTFVFLLTGKTPDQFTGSLKKGLIWQQEAQGYRQELRDLIDELMRPDVEERPINAQAVLERLQPFEDFHKTKLINQVVSVNGEKEIDNNNNITIGINKFLLIFGLLTGFVGLTAGLVIPFNNSTKIQEPSKSETPKPAQTAKPAPPKTTPTPKPAQTAKPAPPKTTPKPAQTAKPSTPKPTPKPAQTAKPSTPKTTPKPAQTAKPST